MTKAPNWGRIPEELRQRPQWAVAAPCVCEGPHNKENKLCHFKSPMGVSGSGFFNAKVNDHTTWVDFTTAANAAHANNYDIGYMLHEADPYTCIDFDVKDYTNEEDQDKWTTPEQRQRMEQLHYVCASYSEVSTRGKGLHIWLRGKIGKGRRREGIEIYSQERFIICTGNVINAADIRDGQSILNELVLSLGTDAIDEKYELVELPAVISDDEVIAKLMASEAVKDKFIQLARGNWQVYGFPSQSEADLALMSYFTFYSKSNDQCRRLFRMTELGKRKKAVKNNKYIDFTLTIVRKRQDREEAHMRAGEQSAAALIAKLNADGLRQLSHPTPLHVPGVEGADAVVHPQPPAVALTLALPAPAVAAEPAIVEGLPWPPGFAGAIAQFIYQSAPRPVKEVAIVAALGFLSGICGKAWYIPQSGLNMYWILVARSAIGKEALHSGISALLTAAQQQCPSILTFVDFSDFASGPALTKACAVNQSFVNIAGEWGRKLKKLANDTHDASMASLRTVMTNLYQKSGPQSMVGGITYSNRDTNIASVSGVAFSMVGETTPNTFYESLTEEMMADGFLSRFTVIQYEGERPPLNAAPVLVPDKSLADAVGQLAQYAQNYIGRHMPQPVERTDAAAKLMWDFEKECDEEINSSRDEAKRQMWNRGSLKVMRISGLLAVADNCVHPVIEPHHVEWALRVVRHNIALMRNSLEQGDVGISDHTRERKLISILKEYLLRGAPPGYNVSQDMQKQGIIPRNLIQTRTARISAFSKHRLEATAATDLTIKSLLDSGYIMDVDRAKSAELFNFQGKCYRILQPTMDYDANLGGKK